MPLHLLREIDNLKKEILTLGSMAEQAVQRATAAIETCDGRLAQEVIENDVTLDEMEVQIEEDCLKTLALHQPVAVDLRFIVAVLKINGDLERVGDLAVNVAERAVFLAAQPSVDVVFDFQTMAEKAQGMLRRSLDSLVNLNAEQARGVILSDDEIDAMNRRVYQIVQEAIHIHPDHAESLLHMLSAARHLERIADHATNIAEDVIYMIEGVIVRHKAEDYLLQRLHA
ncbi:MAG TPA: phosphate signaling complex protein PhoU [Sedimentisphaerales bacterium]|jgi:phosphate transport system protein|nr:phosphate signaling complex protein PhoU [Sedimentisphaerales bacterium]HNU31849.1 phosphate signaling complex protein PhoU [Sedimentisphaerales bacterium]